MMKTMCDSNEVVEKTEKRNDHVLENRPCKKASSKHDLQEKRKCNSTVQCT